MKFPYGITDFQQLITENYFYVDRTGQIPHIESAGKQLLFLRPRRFGKSLLLSMLENYYDLARADQFEPLFGRLAIGRKPTPSHNQYFVLKWDFSTIAAHGDVSEIHQALYNYINSQIEDFAGRYQPWLRRPVQVNPADAIHSFQLMLNAIKATPHRLYLLIDEYDNFANEILMSGQPQSQSRYEALLYGEGTLKTLFKTIKAGAAGGGVERVFIMGVAPIVLSDLSSGYNVAKNIYLDPAFQSLCGFTESDIADAVMRVTTESGESDLIGQGDEFLSQMRAYYNGYRFTDAPCELVYNPTLALYFLDHVLARRQAPANMLDSNLAMDRGKLHYIGRLPDGPRVIVDALQDDTALRVPVLADRFGVEDLLTVQQDQAFMVSLLYYFGVLTIAGRDVFRNFQLRIPNLVMRRLYLERLQEILLPQSARNDAQRAAETLYQMGDLQPVCDFIEQHYFKVFDNRDYLHANELTVKTAFLTLLYNDQLYTAESETTLGRRHADLTMILRPDARESRLFDLLLEFKFVKLGDLGLRGDEARRMSRSELAALPPVQRKLAEARGQAADYLRELRALYSPELQPRVFAVVALGFERLVWEEIE